MALFGKQQYCSSCLESVRSANAVCPLCGFDPSARVSQGRYLKPQTVLNGRYLVGCAVSENAFSVTYKALDLTEKKKKILKEYCPFSCAARNLDEKAENTLVISNDKEAVFRKGLAEFAKNARSIVGIELPGIMNATDVVETKGTCYLVTDMEEGEPLRRAVRPGKDIFTADEMFTLMKPMINSLTELHGRNIIHADISPFNILISPDRKKATLIGFSLGEEEIFDGAPKRGFTALEEYPAFKGSVGAWTDIYGLCVSIYYGITGVIPTDAPDRTVDDDIVPPSELGAAVSEDREAVLMQGMAVYERDRFKAVRALYNALYSEEEEVSYYEEEETEPVNEPGPEPVYEAAPEPEPVHETAPAPAPAAVQPSAAVQPAAALQPAAANADDRNYSQVIVHRKDKDHVEVNGTLYPVKLDKLDLSGTGLTDSDTRDLARLTEMEYLSVDNNNLGSIEFVASMKKLITLSAENNYIKDISMLVNLPEIREISFKNNKELTDVSVFEYIRRVRKLDLSGTGVTDIRPLFFLDQLRSLDLRGTRVTPRQIKKLYAEMPSCTIKYDFEK